MEVRSFRVILCGLSIPAIQQQGHQLVFAAFRQVIATRPCQIMSDNVRPSEYFTASAMNTTNECDVITEALSNRRSRRRVQHNSYIGPSITEPRASCQGRPDIASIEQVLIQAPDYQTQPDPPRRCRRRQRKSTDLPVNSPRKLSRKRPCHTNRLNTSSQSQQRRVPAAIGGKPIPVEALKLRPPTFCPHCEAKLFQYETSNLCCGNGQVKLATNEYPEELMKLFTLDGPHGKHFRTYSRTYNNLFAFSSLGGKFDKDTSKGIHVFKAHGQVYHTVPDLIPMDNVPRYLQLYFYDSQHEKQNRHGLFPDLDPNVISLLMEIMADNPYAKFFRSLNEIDITCETVITLNSNTTLDQRVYNAPTSEDVAAVWLDSSSFQGNEGPHVLTYGRSSNSHTHTVKHYYGCYDPLQYPLLFPKGDCGWHQGPKKITLPPQDGVSSSSQFPINLAMIQQPEDLLMNELQNAARRHTRADKYVSCREYYAYKLHIRPGSHIIRAGRIFQQFIVDMYVKLENTRLDFFRTNQPAIRADLYQGILDTLAEGEENAANAGHRIILPATFLGGHRDLQKRYLNAMALVQRYGKPDLFVTITCNPKWPEILAELGPNEEVCHRPDLVAQIFNAKLTALKKKLRVEKVFGDIAAIISVVEFQKRGLPHAHILIILTTDYKINAPEAFDKYVCAEIPSEDNPHLSEIVKRHMIHGPCGDKFQKCACMTAIDPITKKKVCKHKCPRQHAEYTTTGADCYPTLLYSVGYVASNNSRSNPFISSFNAFLGKFYLFKTFHMEVVFDSAYNFSIKWTVSLGFIAIRFGKCGTKFIGVSLFGVSPQLHLAI